MGYLLDILTILSKKESGNIIFKSSVLCMVVWSGNGGRVACKGRMVRLMWSCK